MTRVGDVLFLWSLLYLQAARCNLLHRLPNTKVTAALTCVNPVFPCQKEIELTLLRKIYHWAIENMSQVQDARNPSPAAVTASGIGRCMKVRKKGSIFNLTRTTLTSRVPRSPPLFSTLYTGNHHLYRLTAFIACVHELLGPSNSACPCLVALSAFYCFTANQNR